MNFLHFFVSGLFQNSIDLEQKSGIFWQEKHHKNAAFFLKLLRIKQRCGQMSIVYMCHSIYVYSVYVS